MNNVIPFPPDRAQGKTTRQIKDAPPHALFVCVNPTHLSYCEQIAERFNRLDIAFVTPTYFVGQSWRGRDFPSIIIDHAAYDGMNEIERYYVTEALMQYITYLPAQFPDPIQE